MSCSQEGCATPDRFSVVWPGRGRIRYCTAHYLKMCTVAEACGLPHDSLDVQPTPEGKALMERLLARLEAVNVEAKAARDRGDVATLVGLSCSLDALLVEINEFLFPGLSGQ